MNKRHLLTSALSLIMATACSDSTGVETADLLGEWEAQSMVMSSVEDPTMTVDLMELGADVTVTFTADATYTVFETESDGYEDESGTYTVSGSVLTTVEMVEGQAGDSEEMAIVLNGNSMTLTMSDIFDFNDDGTETPAVLVIGFTRSVIQ
jgi:hypothetical protein